MARSTVSHRHHVGVTTPPRRVTPQQNAHHQWSSVGESSPQEGAHVPRTCRGGRTGSAVLAAEVEGRWSGETAQFLQGLAKARAQSVPWILQERVEAAWIRRWSCILACSAARAFATSLLERRPTPGTGGEVPSVNKVLRDARFV